MRIEKTTDGKFVGFEIDPANIQVGRKISLDNDFVFVIEHITKTPTTTILSNINYIIVLTQ